MNYLITAAGSGSRFSKSGIKPPKPLIRAKGRELLIWSLSSFPITDGDKIYLITLREHRVKEAIAASITFLYPNAILYWLEIEELLSGQLLTAIAAIKHFGITGPLIIHNCDTYYDASRSELISYLANPSCFGVIPCFNGIGDHWSFVKTTDESNTAIEVAEKQRISDSCSVGTYGFTDTSRAIELAEAYIGSSDVPQSEYYIAPFYQYIIDQGLTVKVTEASSARLFGTPEELIDTFGITFYQLLADNAWDAHQRGTLVVDIDGTLCGGLHNGDYTLVAPIEEVCAALKRANNKGYYIILFTARNMRTFRGSLGLINKYTAPLLHKWLDSHDIPYDEIYFGKPWGQNVKYIDDKSLSIIDFVDS